MNIGLLVIATRKYREYAPALMRSAKEHFFPDHDVTYHLFSEAPMAGWEHHHTEAHGWPNATLLRYHEFSRARPVLVEDYLFYIDVDSRFERTINAEICAPLVGLHHSGFEEKEGSWEDRVESQAFVDVRQRYTYFAGGFNGGERTAFLDMAETIVGWIDEDTQRGILAEWHDESYLNRYFVEHKPKVLPRGFGAPEEKDEFHDRHITWLLKDHGAIRA